VALRRFDRKFGADRLRGVADGPGVYLFRDAAGTVIYAGKARSLRRRLAGYRSAGRRKAQRKMRLLVREAHSLEVRPVATERDALLLENDLIRKLRPRYNVDAAFDFLYPAWGVGGRAGQLWLCLTTRPDAFAALDLSWHGCFRSRLRSRAAFDALVDLVGRVGHREPPSRRPPAPRFRGSRLEAFRRLPPGLAEELRGYLDGAGGPLLPGLFAALLESRLARRQAAEVQEGLATLRGFHRHDVLRLARARAALGLGRAFVPQAERDALFIRAAATPPASAPRVRPGRLGTGRP